MHTLLFLEPGHFHAALTLRERHPLVRGEIVVYAPEAPELREFLALVDAFNRRSERPTGWRPVVRVASDPLDRLLAERAGDVVILAGRNDRKMALIRQLHDAGLHVLADKPWLVRTEALADLEHTLAGGPLVMEIMTGRHEITAILEEKLVREPEVFGAFRRAAGEDAAITLESVHHLEKMVNGASLRRPPWFFDVRVQGDGLADIPTHLVDRAQRLVEPPGTGGAGGSEPQLLSARCWPTLVPREVFCRVTGSRDFPPELREHVEGDALACFCNGELSFRLHGVTVQLASRWDLSSPPGGGDTHRAALRGTRSVIRIEQGPHTGFRRRLLVEPERDASGVRPALERAVEAWHAELPGLSVVPAAQGFEIRIPDSLRTGHESHFPLVLDEFLAHVERGSRPAALAADTFAKYALLARAREAHARDPQARA